ncbi:Glycosyltransferase [Candidatus Paraburkholderia calva]|nr:Glycosyltransferase [Candidatus Paraburkholderia calva]
MRILQVVLVPRLSGAEVLAKGVAIGHQQEGGHDVCITSLMPEHDDFRHISAELRTHGVECIFPSKSLGKAGRLLFLHRAIRAFKPDIIFAHATIPAIYVRLLPTRVPIVWVMHSGANDFANRALLRAERLLSSRVKAVIGVSQKQIDNYVEEIDVEEIGLHPSMIVVPNGVDVSCFTDETLPVAPSVCKQIVQVGRYLPEKNQLRTVEAFTRVARAEPDPRLLLCGVIENLDYYKAGVDMVTALGLKDRVSIEGPQTNVAQNLRGSTVYAMPSNFEAHSVGFLEALASGIPVVANAIPSFTFAANFPSVQLLDTTDIDAYGRRCSRRSRSSAPRAHSMASRCKPRRTAIWRLRDVLNLRVGLS